MNIWLEAFLTLTFFDKVSAVLILSLAVFTVVKVLTGLLQYVSDGFSTANEFVSEYFVQTWGYVAVSLIVIQIFKLILALIFL